MKPQLLARLSLAIAMSGSMTLARAGLAQTRDAEELRRALADDLTKIVRERFTPAPTVQVDGTAIRVEFGVRPFQVHWRDASGRWSRETRTEVGPEAYGFLIEVFVSSGPYDDVMPRPNTTADAYCPGTLRHGPYFDTYFTKTDFVAQHGGLQMNILVPCDSNLEPVCWIHRRLLERCAERNLLASAASQPTSNDVRLRSRDQQERLDAFFEYFGGMLGFWNLTIDGVKIGPSGPEPGAVEKRLAGQTTGQIEQLLGSPTSAWRCEEANHEWLEARYEFDGCPTAVTPELREYWRESRRPFALRLYFRDRILVGYKDMWRERNIDMWEIRRADLGFREPTAFP
jgi:hypothetical protein